MVDIAVDAFWAPKEGSSEGDWEDGYDFDEAIGVLAVADGASTSYRAGEWARWLVESFVSRPLSSFDRGTFTVWVDACAQSSPLPAVGGDVPWYVKEAAARGSFSTFLGVRCDIQPSTQRVWSAVAVGDTCLFHIRGSSLQVAFPIDNPDAFGVAPPLLSSNLVGQRRGAESGVFTWGSCSPGDVLLVATDALAQWALRTARPDPTVWSTLCDLSDDTFHKLLGELRLAGAIADDDVTLLRCHLGER